MDAPFDGSMLPSDRTRSHSDTADVHATEEDQEPPLASFYPRLQNSATYQFVALHSIGAVALPLTAPSVVQRQTDSIRIGSDSMRLSR